MFDTWGTGEWTFIIIFLVQFGAVVWLMATMQQRMKDVESRVAAIEAHNIGENLATIKTKLEQITNWIDKQG